MYETFIEAVKDADFTNQLFALIRVKGDIDEKKLYFSLDSYYS